MHPLIITLAFLMLLGALVTGRVKESLPFSLSNQLYKNALHLENKIANEREASLLHEWKEAKGENKPKTSPTTSTKSRSERKSTSLEFDCARPPNNSRLNFYHIDLPHIYETAAHLLRNLYDKSPYLYNHPNMEYQLLNALQQSQDKIKEMTFADELGELHLNDPYLQEMLSSLLKGGLDINQNPLPSLLYYISIDKESKNINFLFAPPEILYALLDNPLATENLLNARKIYWEMIFDHENHYSERLKGEGETRTSIQKTVSTGVTAILNDHQINLTKTFDFTLGKEGNILFVTDPITQIIHREKTTY